MSTQNSSNEGHIKPVFERYVAIDENIHATLSLHSLSLYMTLRFEGQYTRDQSSVRRTAKFLYTKAKIKRSQYYLSLNELEQHGLIRRDPGNQLGTVGTIFIARELNYFNRPPIRHTDTPIRHTDTLIINSLHNNTTTSELQNRDRKSEVAAARDESQKSIADVVPELKSAKAVNREGKYSPSGNNVLLWDMILAYRTIFPENPQPHPKVIATSLQKTMQTLIKRWHELDPDGKPLSIEAFTSYLTLLRERAPKFSLGEYETQDGNRKKNSLETFCRWNTVVKFLEGSYS